MLVISGAATVNYTNDGGIPQITSATSPNDPANFHWLVTDRGGTDVGRVNVPVEKRETETTGARFAVTWGGDDLNLKMGAAYDEVSRDIRPLGNDSAWSAAACGGNPSNFAQPPNAQPPCRGQTTAEIAAANAAAVAAGTGASVSHVPELPRLSHYGRRSAWLSAADAVRLRHGRLGRLRARLQLRRASGSFARSGRRCRRRPTGARFPKRPPGCSRSSTAISKSATTGCATTSACATCRRISP